MPRRSDLYGLVLVPSLVIVGATLGAAIGGQSSGGMGWDKLASGLGGLLPGARCSVASWERFSLVGSADRPSGLTPLSGLAAAGIIGYMAWKIRQVPAPEPIPPTRQPTAVPPPQPGG